MPHKRAKRTTRELEREKRGIDLPPSGSTSTAQESVPKSLTRVLNAATVRESYRKKRVQSDADIGGQRAAKRRRKDTGEGPQELGIKHGESLVHFNRRVEDDMRVPVANAIHASRNHAKKAKCSSARSPRLEMALPSSSAPTKPLDSKSDRTSKTEFDPKPSAKRLNDVVQAPPSFTRLPRGSIKAKIKTSDGDNAAPRRIEGVVNMVQRQRMEKERERAILHYRKLKDAKLAGGLSDLIT